MTTNEPSKNKIYRNNIKNKRNVKPAKVVFSDSEDDIDPIPLLKKARNDILSSSDGSFDEKYEARPIKPKPKRPTGSLRRPLLNNRRPIPNRTKPAQRFKPTPPNKAKVPIFENNEPQIEKSTNSDESNNHPSQTQSSISSDHEVVEEQPIKKLPNSPQSQLKKEISLPEEIDIFQMPKSTYIITKTVPTKLSKKITISLSQQNGENPQNNIIQCSFELKDKITYFERNQKCAILFANKFRTFGLRKNDQFGEELMSTQFSDVKKPVPHRKCVVHFFINNIGLPRVIKNKIQDKNSLKNSKDKNDKYFASTKNLVFENNKNQEIIIVRRISKTELKITSVPTIPEEFIFLLGLSVFISKTN